MIKVFLLGCVMAIVSSVIAKDFRDSFLAKIQRVQFCSGVLCGVVGYSSGHSELVKVGGAAVASAVAPVLLGNLSFKLPSNKDIYTRAQNINNICWALSFPVMGYAAFKTWWSR